MIFLCLKEHTSHHFPSPVGVSMVTPVVNHILPKTSNAHKTPSTPKEMALKSISWDDLLQKSGHFHVQKSKLYPAFTGKQIQNFFDLFYNFYIIQSLQILKQKTKNRFTRYHSFQTSVYAFYHFNCFHHFPSQQSLLIPSRQTS